MPEIQIVPPDFKKLIKGFGSLSDSLQRKVIRSAVRAGAGEARKSIRKKTPRSRVSKTRELWSASTAQRREAIGKKDPLRQSLTIKPSSKWRKARQAAAQGIIGATVGHDYSIGPHAHLVQDGFDLHAWSSDPSGIWVSGTGYFRKGKKEAESQAKSAMISKAKAVFAKEMEKAFKKASR